MIRPDDQGDAGNLPDVETPVPSIYSSALILLHILRASTHSPVRSKNRICRPLTENFGNFPDIPCFRLSLLNIRPD